jgi:hypothetical protein
VDGLRVDHPDGLADPRGYLRRLAEVTGGAWVVAEKIRRVTSELTLEANGERIATSLSIGVVSSPEDGTTADELMIAADEAMYSSKRLGKNRVVAYSKADHFELPTRHRRRHTTQGLRPLPSEGEGEGESEGDGEGQGEGDGEGPGDGKGPGEGRLVEREQRS